jgi:hypothetical protein
MKMGRRLRCSSVAYRFKIRALLLPVRLGPPCRRPILIATKPARISGTGHQIAPNAACRNRSYSSSCSSPSSSKDEYESEARIVASELKTDRQYNPGLANRILRTAGEIQFGLADRHRFSLHRQWLSNGFTCLERANIAMAYETGSGRN